MALGAVDEANKPPLKHEAVECDGGSKEPTDIRYVCRERLSDSASDYTDNQRDDRQQVAGKGAKDSREDDVRQGRTE